mmetsp:Transcript_9226/g.16005  ORF Transcript_9226/g.16005 Transcript_9226/m.16005 type:complete len:723 (-) Transcript_9226:99-2267(-)
MAPVRSAPVVATDDDLVAVTIRHETEDQTVTVHVEPDCTVGDVIEELAAVLDRPEIIDEVQLVKASPWGGKMLLASSKPLGAMRSLVATGATLEYYVPEEIPPSSLYDFEEFEPNTFIGTPRSLKVCEVEGILPEDLVYVPHDVLVESGAPLWLTRLRHAFLEVHRQDLLDSARAAWEIASAADEGSLQESVSDWNTSCSFMNYYSTSSLTPPGGSLRSPSNGSAAAGSSPSGRSVAAHGGLWAGPLKPSTYPHTLAFFDELRVLCSTQDRFDRGLGMPSEGALTSESPEESKQASPIVAFVASPSGEGQAEETSENLSPPLRGILRPSLPSPSALSFSLLSSGGTRSMKESFSENQVFEEVSEMVAHLKGFGVGQRRYDPVLLKTEAQHIHDRWVNGRKMERSNEEARRLVWRRLDAADAQLWRAEGERERYSQLRDFLETASKNCLGPFNTERALKNVASSEKRAKHFAGIRSFVHDKDVARENRRNDLAEEWAERDITRQAWVVHHKQHRSATAAKQWLVGRCRWTSNNARMQEDLTHWKQRMHDKDNADRQKVFDGAARKSYYLMYKREVKELRRLHATMAHSRERRRQTVQRTRVAEELKRMAKEAQRKGSSPTSGGSRPGSRASSRPGSRAESAPSGQHPRASSRSGSRTPSCSTPTHQRQRASTPTQRLRDTGRVKKYAARFDFPRVAQPMPELQRAWQGDDLGGTSGSGWSSVA